MEFPWKFSNIEFVAGEAPSEQSHALHFQASNKTGKETFSDAFAMSTTRLYPTTRTPSTHNKATLVSPTRSEKSPRASRRSQLYKKMKTKLLCRLNWWRGGFSAGAEEEHDQCSGVSQGRWDRYETDGSGHETDEGRTAWRDGLVGVAITEDLIHCGYCNGYVYGGVRLLDGKPYYLRNGVYVDGGEGEYQMSGPLGGGVVGSKRRSEIQKVLLPEADYIPIRQDSEDESSGLRHWAGEQGWRDAEFLDVGESILVDVASSSVNLITISDAAAASTIRGSGDTGRPLHPLSRVSSQGRGGGFADPNLGVPATALVPASTPAIVEVALSTQIHQSSSALPYA